MLVIEMMYEIIPARQRESCTNGNDKKTKTEESNRGCGTRPMVVASAITARASMKSDLYS